MVKEEKTEETMRMLGITPRGRRSAGGSNKGVGGMFFLGNNGPPGDEPDRRGIEEGETTNGFGSMGAFEHVRAISSSW